MTKYKITGMNCAACSARVEKAVGSVKGVTSCSVSLLTNSMGVEGTATPEAIIAAVEKAGYGASLEGVNKSENTLEDKATPVLKKRLLASLIFLIVLMYFSMGHMMWGFPVPAYFENPVALGLLELLLTAAVMVINQKFFISGFKGLIHRAPNMDTLVALGSSAAFVYSVYALFKMIGVMETSMHEAMALMDEFYFESSAMILTLITVGKLLESISKGKTTDALKGLMQLAPKTAVVVKDGKEVTVPIEQVQKDDIFAVRPGENIPVDGVITEGKTAVNESALTGESVPVDKAEGDNVSAATLNTSGYIRCRALRVGEDTTLSQIIKMVSDAAATKAPIAKIADKVSGVFVPAVITIAIITALIWLIAGEEAGFALARGISVLVISCPCALGLATPVAIMVGSGLGAKNGVLFKTAASLEEAGRIEIAVLDKTGTITKGEPHVTDVVTTSSSENELIQKAAALEAKSEHPLAKAILEESKKLNITPHEISDFEALSGNGLRGKLGKNEIIGGSVKYISEIIDLDKTIEEKTEKLSEEGKTPLLFAENGSLIGVIAVADVIKEDSPTAIKELKNMGIKTVMLTGDNERTAKAIGKQAGVDQVIAGVLPGGKESVVRSLKNQGKVAMVGDGINDAPALTRADIGIAIGAGTDVAIDAADIVLMKSNLSDVPAAIRLGRATLRNIHENLFWAFFYNVIGIPLAAGALIPLFGLRLNPMFAAAAMSLSSFCVVTNALRLNLFNVHNSSKDKKIRKETTENMTNTENTTEKTLKIEGMMCEHCEARVKKALEALPQVDEAKVSHVEGTAHIKLNSPVSDAILKKAIKKADYKLISIK